MDKSEAIKKRMKQLEKLASPLVKFLNDNYNPHAKIEINSSGCELLMGEIGIPITKYIKD